MKHITCAPCACQLLGEETSLCPSAESPKMPKVAPGGILKQSTYQAPPQTVQDSVEDEEDDGDNDDDSLAGTMPGMDLLSRSTVSQTSATELSYGEIPQLINALVVHLLARIHGMLETRMSK